MRSIRSSFILIVAVVAHVLMGPSPAFASLSPCARNLIGPQKKSIFSDLHLDRFWVNLRANLRYGPRIHPMIQPAQSLRIHKQTIALVQSLSLDIVDLGKESASKVARVKERLEAAIEDGRVVAERYRESESIADAIVYGLMVAPSDWHQDRNENDILALREFLLRLEELRQGVREQDQLNRMSFRGEDLWILTQNIWRAEECLELGRHRLSEIEGGLIQFNGLLAQVVDHLLASRLEEALGVLSSVNELYRSTLMPSRSQHLAGLEACVGDSLAKY